MAEAKVKWRALCAERSKAGLSTHHQAADENSNLYLWQPHLKIVRPLHSSGDRLSHFLLKAEKLGDQVCYGLVPAHLESLRLKINSEVVEKNGPPM